MAITRPLKPTKSTDPLLQQIFDEQQRLGMTTTDLAQRAGLPKPTVDGLRQPRPGRGKVVPINYVRRLATAVGLSFPSELQRLDQ